MGKPLAEQMVDILEAWRKSDDAEEKVRAFKICNGARRDENWNSALSVEIRKRWGNSVEKEPIIADW